MKGRKSGAITLFIGLLLVVIFAVGLMLDRNPGALTMKNRYNLALEQFGSFCQAIWLPAGMIGIPLFLWSLIRNLIRERKEK
jgi:hypothetical protein